MLGGVEYILGHIIFKINREEGHVSLSYEHRRLHNS